MMVVGEGTTSIDNGGVITTVPTDDGGVCTGDSNTDGGGAVSLQATTTKTTAHERQRLEDDIKQGNSSTRCTTASVAAVAAAAGDAMTARELCVLYD